MKMNKKGFTLIELLVVIAIIAILAAAIIASTSSARVQARDARRIQDLDQIATAMAMYYSKNNAYPTTAEGIAELVTDGELSVEPKDPKDGTTAYGYETGTKDGVPRILLRTQLEDSTNSALKTDMDGTPHACYDTPTPTLDCSDSPTPYYCLCR